jgi:8-oxo-dGTP diphosphatase
MEKQRTDHGMSEQEIQANQARYGKGPHLAADLVIFTASWNKDEVQPRVLLIRRRNKPFQGAWALPGGFVDMDEDLPTAARRELREETSIANLDDVCVQQVGAFGHPLRDPRSRVVSAVYMAWVPWRDLPAPQAADDAMEAKLFPIVDGIVVDEKNDPCDLAFDHALVFQKVWKQIQSDARFSSAPLALLPFEFNPSQLQALYESLVGPVDLLLLLDWLQGHRWIQPLEPPHWKVLPRKKQWTVPPWQR